MRKKPIIAMELSSFGKGGGPYTSNIRIMNSPLNEKYDFRTIRYKTELGRGFSVKRIKDIVRQIREIQPDIVHFAGLQLSGFHMAIACKIAKVDKTVITVHGFSGDALYFNPIKKLITTYLLEPITLFLTDSIIGVSEFTSNRKLIKIFKKKSVGAIYNFPPLPVKTDSEIRKELNLGSSDVLIVTVARIVRDKGYHIFDEAILKFNDNENLKFLIVGDGDYLPEMKSKLKNQIDSKQVFFLGHRDDVQQILKGSDIFVLPTLHETLSIALLEASVEGLALIGSNTGGVPEIIEHEYNGILVEPGNVDDLSEAIDLLIKNTDLRIKLAKNAKVMVAQKFSSQIIEAKIDNAYQNLLKLS